MKNIGHWITRFDESMYGHTYEEAMPKTEKVMTTAVRYFPPTAVLIDANVAITGYDELSGDSVNMGGRIWNGVGVANVFLPGVSEGDQVLFDILKDIKINKTSTGNGN